MIENYRPPALEIEQGFLEEIPAGLDRNNVIVVGPAYIHADSASGNLVSTAYADEAEIAYRMLIDGVSTAKPSTHAIDSDSVSLTGSGLWLELFDKGTAGSTAANNAFNAYTADRAGRLIHYKTASNIGFLNTEDDTVAGTYDNGRATQIGDRVMVIGDNGSVERKVVGLVGRDTVASVGGYGYHGATTLANPTNLTVTNVVHAVIDAGDITAAFADVDDTTLQAYARRVGRAATGGGLLLDIELVCVTAGVSSDASTWLARVGGKTVALTAADATGIDFTLLGATINVAADEFITGEVLSFTLTFPQANIAAVLDGQIDLSAYTYGSAVRRVASSLVVEVTAITDAQDAVTLRVYDTRGLIVPTEKVVAGASSLTLDIDGADDGIVITLPAGIFTGGHVGARLTANIQPPTRSATVFDKLLLDAPIGSILTATDGSKDSLRVRAFSVYTGPVAAIETVSGFTNYTADADGITLADGVRVPVSGYTLAADSVKTALDGKGTVSLAWRALIPSGSSAGAFSVNGTSAIAERLGSYALGSELGFGLYQALNGADKAVYGLQVGGTDQASWEAAIRTLETLRNVYVIVPLTTDETILKLFSAHAEAMSAPEVRKFRRVYGSVDSPGEYVKLSTHESAPVTATITAGDGGGYTLVTFGQSGLNLGTANVLPGDKLLVVSTGDTYEISYQGNESTLVLTSGPDSPIAAATAVEIIAADSAENNGRYVWEFAQRLGIGLDQDRRIACIWTHNGVFDTLDGSPVSIPNRFIAAEAGGRRVSLLAQQSMTRKTVEAITDAPAMYSLFTDTILNEMAANGVWIVEQEWSGQQPRHRHQLTTAVDGGPLRYEDSAGVIYDNICFVIDDIVDPLIGNRNVTRRTLAEVKNLVQAALSNLTTSPIDNETAGPMLVNFYDRDGNPDTLNVDFDPEFKDSIILFSELELPLTFNGGRVKLLARTINTQDTTGAVILVQPA